MDWDRILFRMWNSFAYRWYIRIFIFCLDLKVKFEVLVIQKQQSVVWLFGSRHNMGKPKGNFFDFFAVHMRNLETQVVHIKRGIHNFSVSTIFSGVFRNSLHMHSWLRGLHMHWLHMHSWLDLRFMGVNIYHRRGRTCPVRKAFRHVEFLYQT